MSAYNKSKCYFVISTHDKTKCCFGIYNKVNTVNSGIFPYIPVRKFPTLNIPVILQP